MSDTYHRDETSAEKYDRHWIELLQELRLAQSGTQILFAFLLAISFTQPFRDDGDFTHVVFTVTLICAALATCLLIAPVALHRLVYARGVRDAMIRVADRLAQGGLVMLLATVCGGLLLALDVALDRVSAIVITGIVALFCIVSWYVLPLFVRRQGDRRPARDDGEPDDHR